MSYGDAIHLAEHAHEPTVQNEMIAYADQLAAPFTLRDIYYPLRLPKTAVQRVLDRWLRKGFVTRRPIPNHTRGRGQPLSIYLYTMAEPA